MQGYNRRHTLDPLDEDPIYEDRPAQVLRVVNGGIEPRHMRKGSYIEDETYTYAEEYNGGGNGGIPQFPVPYGGQHGGGYPPDVSGSRMRELVPGSQQQVQYQQQPQQQQQRGTGRNGNGGGRSTARRSLIQGPQPQPVLQTNPYSSYQPAPKPRYPNPSNSVDNYRQQQQQQQVYTRPARLSAQALASPSLDRYTPPLEADEDAEDENNRARSIMIGFEQPSPSTKYPTAAAAAALGAGSSNNTTPGSISSSYNSASTSTDTSDQAINSFPFPPSQLTSNPQSQLQAPTQGGLMPNVNGRRVSNSSTNSLQPKRGHPSSYYSQASYLVSPIPEESSDYGRHGSFASSHAIPSSWGSGIPGLWIPGSNEELMSDGASSISKGSGKSRGNDYEDYDEGTTLVRQASMGRKQKPKLTNVKAPLERSDSSAAKSKSSRSTEASSSSHRTSQSFSRLHIKQPSSNTIRQEIPSFPVSRGMAIGMEKPMSQPIGSPMEIQDEPLQPPPKLGFWQRLSQLSIRSSTSDVVPKPLRIPTGTGSPDLRLKEGQSPLSATDLYNSRLAQPQQAVLNRPRPPRLNIDAVREAEARGNLTSLPDLIRRATKLAAVLETGTRPDSRWGGSRAPSIMSTDTSNPHHGRYQESLSDILASFPPPLASGRRLSSRGTAWPLPQDVGYMQQHSQADTPSIRRRRKICGLPLWAFILLIILALVVIAAAIILPIQFVALAKDKNKTQALTAETCAVQLPCQNGGIAGVEDGKCHCICTGNFFGPTCTESNDPACTAITVQEASAEKQVFLGKAIPRVLNVSEEKFRVPLDPLALSEAFSAQKTSCSLQNALITFNGRSAPIGESLDGGSETSPSGFVLDDNVVDFGRVAVLYLAGSAGMVAAEAAYGELTQLFTKGKDYGVVKVGSTIEIDLGKLRIVTSDGAVGGPAATRLRERSSDTMVKKVAEDIAGRFVRARHLHGHRGSW